MTNKRHHNAGYYTKLAALLSIVLVALTLVFAQKYRKLFKPVDRVRRQTYQAGALSGKQKPLESRPDKHKFLMNQVLAHQRETIKGITQKNERVVANWQKKFAALYQETADDWQDKKDRLDFLTLLYTQRLESLATLVQELLPARGVDNNLQAGDLLVVLELYELALSHYSEALTLLGDAGFAEDKRKRHTIRLNQRIAQTLLQMYAVSVKKEDPVLLEQAADYLSEALKLDKNNADTEYLQTRLLYESGAEVEEIIAALDRVLAIKSVPSQQLEHDFMTLRSDLLFLEFLADQARGAD